MFRIAIRKTVCLVVVLALMGGFVAQVTAQSTRQAQQGIQALQNIQAAFRAVAQKVQPTVVEVNVVDVVKRPVLRFESPFDFFFGPRGERDSKDRQEREYRRPGLGSGVIVRKTGNKVYVLTNNHVVSSADEIGIKLTDEREFDATLVGRDEKKDLAMVVFETTQSVPVADLGDSDTVEVGDWALAIGNPFGFESTVTVGVISAVGRRSLSGSGVGGFTDYRQTDAAINQGNSGGALVNIEGQVVGINTWIASPSGGSVGLGFAIPINNAKKAIDDFISKGKVEYGWLGITVGNLSQQVAEDLKVKGTQGALVYGVFKDSPAAKAGVLPGDYITEIDGNEVQDSSHLLSIVGDLPPGKLVQFDLIRDGGRKQLNVKIEARAEEREIDKQSNRLWPGISVVKITERLREQLDLPKSAGEVIVGVVRKGSPSDIAGFRSGDIIKKINGRDVRSVVEFYRLLNDLSKQELMFTVHREGNDIIIGLVR
jgi:Do/DeqQ family serine protease